MLLSLVATSTPQVGFTPREVMIHLLLPALTPLPCRLVSQALLSKHGVQVVVAVAQEDHRQAVQVVAVDMQPRHYRSRQMKA